MLQAQGLELLLSLGTQRVRPRRPEACDRCSDGGVVDAGVGVNITGIGNLALCGRVDAVDLGAGERLESRDAELFGEGIYAGVLEELVASVIDRGDGRA